MIRRHFLIDLASLAGGVIWQTNTTSNFIMIAWIENLAIRIGICE